MDLRLLVGIVGSLTAVWLVLIGVLWVLRPKGMRLGEVVRIVPDVLRLGVLPTQVVDGSPAHRRLTIE